MIIEKIGTGASIQLAYEDAKKQLAAPDEAELHQEIIQDAKKKFFGLKNEPAKVKVWYEVPDKKVQKEPVKPAQTPPVKQAAPTQKAVSKTEKTEKKPAAKKTDAPAVTKENDKKQAEPEKANTSEAKPVEESIVTAEISKDDTAANYIKMILDGMSINDYTLTLNINQSTGEYIYQITCEDDGTIIGRRGETLDAIQYLLRLSINKGKDDNKARKLTVNVGNYREKRSENLQALAQRSAKQVLKYGKNVVLNPMNPYERRIVHTAIQEIEGVTSHSVGVDTGRKVVISLEAGVQPTHPSRGGYNNRGGKRGYNKGGNKGGYRKKEAYQPAQTREPRKDSAGALYGKIELPNKDM